jgi:hypothetical protein
MTESRPEGFTEFIEGQESVRIVQSGMETVIWTKLDREGLHDFLTSLAGGVARGIGDDTYTEDMEYAEQTDLPSGDSIWAAVLKLPVF